MGMRSRTKNFVISGGILTTDFILNLQEEEPKQPLIKPNTFSIPPNLVIKNQNQLDNLIKEAWERLLEKWDEISVRLKSMNESDSGQQWTVPFLKSLGFIDIQYSKKEISFEDDKIHVFISHRGWARADAPKIHVVGPNQELDKRLDIDRNKKSPHDSLQLYLKLDKSLMKWGIVTNGLQIRLLRDFFHTHTRGYVEFDVESILYERNFTDFRTLYRLIHISRFIKNEENETILDKFYEKSVAAGSKIGEGLRENVKRAIELICNGLLTHEIRESMIKNEIIVKDFYQEILRVIYRILFLMFAEQRGMLPMHNSLYVEEYSITKLRERAETRIVSDNHFDLWHGLFATFSLIREGSEELDVFGYNGDLFDDTNLNHILALKCKNNFLLRAIKYLTLYEKGKILQRINFLDLGVEEIGAIYESLLDFTPRILDKNEEIKNEVFRKGEFILDPRGAGRKSSGSYYTDKRLIGVLIDSALKSIVETTISQSGETLAEKEKAILQLKVCDPACGSGAFLIAANNFIGKELAKIRADSEYPSEREERLARRDVLKCCIYGVDLNPMAIELAKVSLWINASVKEYPLNFLDHHLKCGDSIIGTQNNLIEKGILNSSFSKKLIDNMDKISEVKRINTKQKEHKGKLLDSFFEKTDIKYNYRELYEILNLPENYGEEVKEKGLKYKKYKKTRNYLDLKLLYDSWTAPFFWDYVKEETPFVTEGVFRYIRNNQLDLIDKSTIDNILKYSTNFKFFHWEIEFPEVFRGENPGFDCIIGNPPWDKIKLIEKEYFEGRYEPIEKAKTAGERKKQLELLEKADPSLYKNYIEDLKRVEKIGNFVKFSSRYSLSNVGEMNLAYVFTEQVAKLINSTGFVGFIIPAGIATEKTTSVFFDFLVRNEMLRNLYIVENKNRYFADVHRHAKFALITFTGEKIKTQKPKYAFFIKDTNELKDKDRIIELDKFDFELINPNTRNCPMFFSKKDSELVKQIYQNSDIIMRDNSNDLPFNFQYMRMFDMTTDSNKFEIEKNLLRDGFTYSKNKYTKQEETFLPLYESRHIAQYNHRYASIKINPTNIFKTGSSILSSKSELINPNFTIKPRFWIKEENLDYRIPEKYKYNWFLAFKDITGATSERVVVSAIIPKTAAGNTLPILLIYEEAVDICCMLANLNCKILDFITRRKISGNHLNLFTLKQLPIIHPKKYTSEQKNLIKKCLLELVFTSNDLKDFAIDLDYHEQPFKYNEERRLYIFAILDSIFMKLYKISENDISYILDSLISIKRRETKSYGKYVSQGLIESFYRKTTQELHNILMNLEEKIEE